MKQTQIEKLFHDMQLETEEQRAAKRFDAIVLEHPNKIQVFTTGTTCSVAEPEKCEFA